MTKQSAASLVVLALCLSTTTGAQQVVSTAEMERMVAEIQASHIAANVPPGSSFARLLDRDIRAYLAARGLPAETVQIEPLRQGPTQSGTSYPKYYLWVRAMDAAKDRIEGAMRVAAIGQVRFEITDFTPAPAIQADPTTLDAIYPASLVPIIRQHAAMR